MKTYIDQIEALSPCGDALVWLRMSKHRSLTKAWAASARGDWMLWLIGHGTIPLTGDAREIHHRRKAATASLACAKFAIDVRYPDPDSLRENLYARMAQVQALIAHPGAWRAEVRECKNSLFGAPHFPTSVVQTLATSLEFLTASERWGFPEYTAVGFAADACSRRMTAAHVHRVCADILRTHYPKPPRLVP